jgi:hypothetical protein
MQSITKQIFGLRNLPYLPIAHFAKAKKEHEIKSVEGTPI